jgi:hypothetical protein
MALVWMNWLCGFVSPYFHGLGRKYSFPAPSTGAVGVNVGSLAVRNVTSTSDGPRDYAHVVLPHSFSAVYVSPSVVLTGCLLRLCSWPLTKWCSCSGVCCFVPALSFLSCLLLL